MSERQKAKDWAKTLAIRGERKLSDMYELVAKQAGFKDWNTYSAHLKEIDRGKGKQEEFDTTEVGYSQGRFRAPQSR